MAISANSLLDELLGNARQDREPPHARSIDNRLEDLRAWAHGQPHNDHAEGVVPPRVSAVGDPMLIDANGKIHHYWGSALMVNFNSFGVMTALEYVGATPDRNYISEVWRYEVTTNKYKYRYFDETPGEVRICTGEVVDGPQFVVGDDSWASEAYEDAVPPEEFFNKFKPSARTFFINGKTGTFMQGPDFGALHQVLKKPVTVSKHLIGSIETEPKNWMQRAADMITENSGYHHLDHSHYHKDDCPLTSPETSGALVTAIKKVQIAQFACGLTVGSMIGELPIQTEVF